MVKRRRITITGRVQGVGFRPAVHKIACEMGLSGFVLNDSRGVTIELQGSEAGLDGFLASLAGPKKPPMADLKSMNSIELPAVKGETGFRIEKSDSGGTALSQVTVDIATCSDCLAELADSDDFRYRYPFINCTNCGPRYSIVKTIPYDRPNTTMTPFRMCCKCASQYRNIADRRFHAQPVACPDCGPKIWLVDAENREIAAGADKTIRIAAEMLRNGKILAIKGIGGFHLAVDACNQQAVLRLRERKHRDHKPFALMAASIGTVREHACADAAAVQALQSAQAPIVLLPARRESPLAPAVATGVSTYGFMLPYAPLHHLLFAESPKVLVMTSANISNEPLICRNDKALDRLADVADAFLMHNRQIYRQVDDSIVHFVDEKPVLLRRARGYVPDPVLIRDLSPEHIFAAGSDLKNTFAFVKDNQLICSEHIGDLADSEVYRHYVASIDHLRGLFEVEPTVIACDLHPGYFSTALARSMPHSRLIEVQHHWAHIAAVLAERERRDPVIGLVADGTGYGTDGRIWGCECLIASLSSFDRFAHLDYCRLAGADRASKEAIRPLMSLLVHALADGFDLQDHRWLLDRVEPDAEKQRIILDQLDKDINCVESSSLGRVFDAVAAALGLGGYNYFDAQLPMALEAVAAPGIDECYDFDLKTGAGGPLKLSLDRMLLQLLADLRSDADAAPVIAAKFHNTLAAAMLQIARKAREATGISTAVLTGGVFCNRYLANRLIRLLKDERFIVLYNQDFPSNDGCVAVGQAAIAANILNMQDLKTESTR